MVLVSVWPTVVWFQTMSLFLAWPSCDLCLRLVSLGCVCDSEMCVQTVHICLACCLWSGWVTTQCYGGVTWTRLTVSRSLSKMVKINKINQIDPNTQNISQNTQLIPIYKTVYKTDPNTHNNRSQYTHQIPTDTTTSSSWCVPSWLICSLLVQIQWLNEWGYGGDDRMPWR